MEDNKIKKHRTMQGSPREKANVEAEKGETILTSDEISNQKKVFHIEGEKHSNGGEPLDAQDGSAIFSDHLKLEDPNLLKVFGFTGNKSKTFAELSKKHDPTKQQEELKKDEFADEITKRSLEKTIDDKLFKQSFAFLLQQVHQEKEGEQQEHSRHFEPALKRFGLSYEDLFNKETLAQEKQSEPANEDIAQQQAKKGAETKIDIISFKPLPKRDGGGTPSFTEKDKKEMLEEGNRVLNEMGFDTYKDYDSFIKSGLPVIQENFKLKPGLTVNYFLNEENTKTRSQAPTVALSKMLKSKKIKATGKDGSYTNEDLQKAYNDGTVSQDDIVTAAKDNLWWYRAPYDKIVSKEEFDKISKGSKAFEIDGKKYYKSSDVAGEYVAYVEKPGGFFEQVEVTAENKKKLDTYDWGKVKGLDPGVQRPEDYRFDWANKRALRAAKQAKRRIPFERPTAQFTDTFFLDQAYYNPDDVIASIQSITGDLSKQQAMFSAPQAQAANQSQLAANAFEQIAQVMGQYADKNVDAYNREQLQNTSIAQNAANQKSNQIQNYLAQNATLKQQYANALNLAEQNIAAQEIGMFDRRAKRKNIEKAVGEQYYIDPDTGFQISTGVGKDFDKTGTKSMQDKIDTYRKLNPNIEYKDIIKLIELESAGKIASDDQYYNEKDYVNPDRN